MSATVDTGRASRAAPASSTTTTTLLAPPGGSGRVEMVRELGLDGLRGLAVAAVVVFHLDRLQGGFLGVDLFFVLSGYLITSLLLREVKATGSVGLGGFWSRRARRLLPALALVVVGIAVLLLAFTPQGIRAGFRGELLATLGYVANWQRVFAESGYWDMFDQASPFDHMWSLAIEEQFYLVWPLAVVAVAGLVGRARRRGGQAQGRLTVSTAVAVVGVVGAGLSLLGLALAYDPIDTNWAYFSTPTRLGPTLLGAALAGLVVDRPRRDGPPAWGWELAAVAGLAVMGWLVVDIDGLGPRYYQGGLLVFALAGLVVVRTVTGGPPGLVARALATPPLRGLGVISYGVYLWHWPVIVYVTSDRARLDGLALDILRVALTLAAATVSYVVVERPIRHGVLRGRRMVRAAGLTAAVTLGAGIIATYGTPIDRTGTGDIPDGPLAGTDTLFLHVPETVPPGAPRILLVGDSGVQYLGPELIDVAAEAGAVVAFSSEVECTPVNPEGITLQTDGEIARREPCHDHRRELWQRLAEEYDPDIVVFYMANAGGIASVRLDDRWVRDCDPAYDAYIEDSIRHDLDLLTSGGAPVVMTTAPYIAVIDGSSAERVDCRNELLHDIAETRPRTEIVDLNGFVLTQVSAGEEMFVDSVHLSPNGGRLTSEWLLPMIVPPA